jgi:methylmalonyl-CoA mutase
MPTDDLISDSGFVPPTQDAWLRLVEKALKGAEFEKRLVQRSADGIRIAPLYTRADALPGAEQSMPGAPPFVRGNLRDHTGLPWQMRQLCIEADPAVAVEAIREEIAAGSNAIGIRVEAPGQAGLAASALEHVLRSVPLDAVCVALSAGEATPESAAALTRAWDSQAVAPGKRHAALGLDPIGDLARKGGLGISLDAALASAARLASDPGWSQGAATVLCADGRVCHEAGGSEAQELAFMAATLIAYLRAVEVAGLSPDRALARIELALAADADLFMTIAKLRATRRIVWRIAEACGAGAASAAVRLAATTSERMMARRDPWVNLLRTCAAGMGAALGGVDALTILPYTAALGRPDGFARRIARNMHVILHEESSIGRVADPAGGAWYLEALTDQLAQAAWAELQAIEAAGGVAQALRTGFIQDRIGRVAIDRAKAIATGRAALTGVSAFPKLGGDGVQIQPYPAPNKPAGTADSVRVMAPMRLADPFEALRDRADAFAARHGAQPSIFLASLGSAADHAARSTWIANFLAAGGIGAIATEGFTNSADAGQAFAACGAAIACICSSDQVYAELAEATAGMLKQAGAAKVLLAGRPKAEAEVELKAAGVDAFLFAGQDAVASLIELHRDLGIA